MIEKNDFQINQLSDYEMLLGEIRSDPLKINRKLLKNGVEPIAVDILKLEEKRIEETSKMMKQQFLIDKLEEEIKRAQAENKEVRVIELLNEKAPRNVMVKQFKTDIEEMESEIKSMLSNINSSLQS